MPELIFSPGHVEGTDLLTVIRPEGTSGKIEAALDVINRLVGARVAGATPEGLLSFSDGTSVQIVLPRSTEIAVSPLPPENPAGNALWVDTHPSPAILKRWNGENWITVGASTSPETPTSIRVKLESLQGAERFHATAIQGLFSGSWRDLTDKPTLGVAVRDGGTPEGDGIETIDFGDNLQVDVANGIATITGHPPGAPHPFVPSKANLYESVKEIIIGAAGITVTPDDVSSELDISQTNVPTPPSHTNNVYIWSQPTRAVPTGLVLGAAQGWPTVIVPEPTQNGFLVLAQTAGDPDLSLAAKDGFNQLPGLTKGAHTFADSGFSYEYWISDDLLFPATVAGRWTFAR